MGREITEGVKQKGGGGRKSDVEERVGKRGGGRGVKRNQGREAGGERGRQ